MSLNFSRYLRNFLIELEELQVEKGEEIGITHLRERVIPTGSSADRSVDVEKDPMFSRLDIILQDEDGAERVMGFDDRGRVVIQDVGRLNYPYSLDLSEVYTVDRCDTLRILRRITGVKIIAYFPSEAVDYILEEEI